jgi:pyruvate/2-oxoglutarate dehydrogenase complex dihydrolipoamide acyltransferase (E2) component
MAGEGAEPSAKQGFVASHPWLVAIPLVLMLPMLLPVAVVVGMVAGVPAVLLYAWMNGGGGGGAAAAPAAAPPDAPTAAARSAAPQTPSEAAAPPKRKVRESVPILKPRISERTSRAAPSALPLFCRRRRRERRFDLERSTDTRRRSPPSLPATMSCTTAFYWLCYGVRLEVCALASAARENTRAGARASDKGQPRRAR